MAQDSLSAIVSAWARLSQAHEQYEAAASNADTSGGDLEKSKQTLEGAIRTYNEACAAQYKALLAERAHRQTKSKT